jgi:DNA-binding IclR family transcriptional regulator
MVNKIMIQVVDRAFNILEVLDDERYCVDGIGVIALSELVELKTPTVHNLLKTLLTLGYVEQVNGSKYRLSFKTSQLGHASANQQLIRQVCEKFARELNSEFNETVVVAMYSRGLWQALFEVESLHRLKVSGLRITKNLYLSGTGRCILSSLPEDKRNKYIEENGLPSSEWPEVKNITQLNKELDIIQKTSYVQMTSFDIFSIATPLCVPKLDIFSAIGLYMPQTRHTAEIEKTLLKKLLPTAKKIIKTMEGY